ncbi:neutral zinc metallopeptidase [Bogoriella caseilytica]|uniref:Neutral zinc metallopeptidase n=1 Tax=Bogoriella caseilytica TaxID=56055 RepID=A0A3N2BGH0_9MICO|nr:neutral zinc metallopeptidase [Bogoriella caseilytica]ROR74330.1 hypothetical protein EDD31_2738 [Bogoriella caseilytica]
MVIVLVIIVIAVVVAILASLARLVPDEAAPAPVTPIASESAPADEGGESSAADPGTPAGTERPEDTAGSIPEFAFDELADHPLLAEGIGLPNLECDLATQGETRSEIEAHASDVIDCLDRMWEPALRAAEIEHRSPGLFVPESLDEISSPCGDGGADYLAFYCPTDESIYLPVDLLGSPPEVMPHYYAWIVAHEYGHHVQYLSGIGQASDAEERARRVFSPGAREVLRRLEIQAECFAGMFLGSSDSAGNLDMSDHYHGFMEWTRTGGPSETHGSGEIQAQWWSAGYLSNRTASCNTYSAPAEEVAAQ